MKKILIIFLLAVLGDKITIYAQKPEIITSDKKGWHKIGETTVDFKVDHDEVSVMGADRFHAIKFMVKDAPIHMVRANITYRDGTGEDILMDYPIEAAGESKTIDLKNGGERDLKKIVFVYKTLPNRNDEKAHIEIWGMKTNTDKKSPK